MTSKYSSIADSSFTGHGYEAEACSVLEHAFSTQRCEDDEHGPLLNSEDGNVASSDSKEVFYWNVRHQCRRYKQGYASKDELKGLWLNCAVTKGWRFNPRNIGWFSTWEAWKDIMPLREVDCILRPKPNVDWSSLTEPGWQDDAGKRVSWDYLASLVPEAGAYCEITKPSKAETQNFKTVDKTEKINWLCRMAHWRNMGVVLIFNGADPTKPPFTRTEDNRLCKPIYWCTGARRSCGGGQSSSRGTRRRSSSAPRGTRRRSCRSSSAPRGRRRRSSRQRMQSLSSWRHRVQSAS